MNFVETAPVISPRLKVEAAADDAAPAASTASKSKVFGVSFAISAAVFSFTLIGMITTVNHVTDTYVIPQLYGRQLAEIRDAGIELPGVDAETDAAVETTSAR